jgi:hypothetical protein
MVAKHFLKQGFSVCLPALEVLILQSGRLKIHSLDLLTLP